MDSRSTQPAAAAKKSILTPVLTLKGHTKNISSISYFPDGKQMISGSYDKTTHRWDLEAGKEIEEARDVCKQEVHAVGVSRDGRWVVTGGGDFTTDHGELEASGVESGMVRTFKGHSAKITCIDISVDSTLLASGSDDFTARIWSLDTGELVAGPFQSADFIGAVGFSQNSKQLAIRSCWSWTHAPVFWTTKDKSIVAAFSFTDDAPIEAKTIYDTSNDDTIKLWAFESRQLLASFHVSFAYHIILSPDSHQLAYTAEGDIKIYICDIPPDILASIQPAQQLPRVHSQPCKPDAMPCPAAVPRNSTMGVIRAQTPGEPPCQTARSTSRGGEWMESWTDRHAGTSCTQLPDMREQRYGPKLPLLRFLRGGLASDLPSTTVLPTMALLPQPWRPSTIGSGLPHLPSQRRDFYPSFVFSNMDTVLPVRNEFGYSPPEVILQNLTEYVTKDEDYPSARGGFGEIWKCTCYIDQSPIKVAVKALQVYTADQLGEAKTKKIQLVCNIVRSCDYVLLHANSVIHGDFNGPNALIYGDGIWCVADFGLSLMYSEVISASQASWTSTLKGNMRWMAPELLVDQGDGSQVRPSEQSDIYSFGGIILQVLTNKVPYYHFSNDAAIILCINAFPISLSCAP
ncbi:WD40-repeat-containing domain protein [Suillus placidus]|uniref:WD40-repeat-containing domain protein n=1 Tax=Suillus placidus TaxID=48579 RepID=A0A9P7D5T8_9AGAM|nr:WD40-repeat-containing domain protein [Suillus placidus]